MREYTDEHRRQAAEWFLAIHDSQDPPAELLQKWGRWLAESTSHRAAFEAVANAYHMTSPSLVAPLTLDGTASSDEPDDYDGSVSVDEWLRMREKQREQPRRVARRWFVPLALAATLATVAILVRWSAGPDAPLEAAASDVFSTRTGEHKELRLPDGSRVTLGARSKLAVDFGTTTRALRLESGEAFFSVQKDPTRPFIVHARDGLITAIGTAFNVRATDEQVSVAVREGVVRVAAEDAPSAEAPVQLSIGEQLSFAGPPIAARAKITHFDSQDVARWRDGWLVYRNEPLRAVIADVARYTNLDLEVSAGVAGDLRFSGAIFKDGVDEWIAALPHVFPVAVAKNGAHRTITPRAPAVTVAR